MPAEPSDPWRLQIFWFELSADKHEQLMTYCGELIGFTNKLTFLRMAFEDATAVDDVRSAYRQVEYHFENYLWHIYAIRERALTALQLFTGESTASLKDPTKRATAVARLNRVAYVPTQMMVELLTLMDDDVELRNRLTHKQFFHIFLYDGDDVWEPDNVLIDQGETVAERMRELLQRFVAPYCDRIRAVITTMDRFIAKLEGRDFMPPEIISDQSTGDVET